MTIRGALNGGSIKANNRYGDLENKISTGTAGIFLSKDKFKESSPYSKQYTDEGELSIYINLHFITEVRRQLAGTEEVGTSTFSPSESTFWNEFLEYQNDVVKYGELLVALEALDDWLVDELTTGIHEDLNRDYSTSHPWRKTEEYVHEKGIKWI